MKLQVEVRDGARRCALCHGGLEGEASTCGGSGAAVHADCLADARGCPTLGCFERRSPVTIRVPAPPAVDLLPVLEGGGGGLVSLPLGLTLGGLLSRPTWELLGAGLALLVPFLVAGGFSGLVAGDFDAWCARRGAQRPVRLALLTLLTLAGAALVATLVVALDRAPSMGGPIF